MTGLELYPQLMDTLMVGHYAAAEDICRQIDAAIPGHPASHYARACVIYARITDLEDTTGRAEFFRLADDAIYTSKQLKKRGATDRVAGSFIRGSAMSAKALMLHREGSTVSALRLMMGARSEFQEAIDLDPAFYEAYLGRGAYRYAVATNAGLVSWLPFIPSAEAGWRDMWLAVERSQFSRYYALSALVWFVLDKKDWSLADSICRVGLERFPGCRSFLWAQLSMHQRRKQWADAEITANELLRQYLAHPENNGYDATGLYTTLMTCADSLGRPDQAIEYARRGLAAYRTDDVVARRKEKLDIMNRRLAKGEHVGRRSD